MRVQKAAKKLGYVPNLLTAMELDIHPSMVTFSLFSHATLRMLIGHRLSPDMPGNADRYLPTDQRDFAAVISR